MLNEQAMQRMFETMGILGETPDQLGRQRRLRAAVEAAYPEIVSSVAAEIADAMQKEDESFGAYVDADWVRECYVQRWSPAAQAILDEAEEEANRL